MKASAVRSGFTSATEIAAQVRKVFSNKPGNTVEDAAIKFIDNHVPELQRLNEAAGYTQWNLLTLGGEDVSKRKPDEGEDIFKQRLEKLQAEYEDVANRAEKAVLDYKNDPDRAKAIVSIYGDRGKLSDEFLRRQVQLAYPVFSEYTIDPALQEEILRRTNRLVMMYGDFMPVVSDKKIADSEIDQLIRQSTDPKQAIELVKAKLAIGNHKLKGEGSTIAEEILEVVKLRNLLAKKAGSPNYYSYQLARQEINEDELVKLQRQVKEAIKPIYDRLRLKMDLACMKRYGIPKEDARLPYFQGGVRFPGILDDVMNFSPNVHFAGKDPRPALKETARLIGTNADDIVDKSDLFPRPGKNPWWYLFPFKVPGDIRSFGNIDPSFKDGMGETFETELHEVMGHGVGYSLVNPDIPDLFKNLHTIITEADAMMMEDLMYNEHWLKEIAKFDDATVETFLTQGRQYRLAQQLIIFFHNVLLIPDFERELYRMKDDELTLSNVNKLWAQKSYEYLGIVIPDDRNEPDWTYKIHLATAPVYYQNYFLGQLVRAQDTAKINELAGARGLFSPECGNFLREYRAIGESYSWFELVKHMTGKDLSVDALKAEFEKLNV
jgi:peptidyl-dipeptidase A